MAKFIKYQIATEIPHDVTITIPLLDENGDPVMQEVPVPALDENGLPVLDEQGEPIYKIVLEPVLVEETRQEVEIVLTWAAIRCSTEASLEANLLIAQKEAYNGEYVVEGEFDREAETTDDILNALLGVTE